MEKEFKKITKQDLKDVAIQVYKEIEKFFKNKKRACIIFLIGDLGSGKTTFSKALAKKLGIKEEVISPTFVLRKDYFNLIHIDGYRFERAEEGKTLELSQELNKDKLIILIEWPERFVEAINLRPDFVLRFEIVNPKERNIFFKVN